MKYIMALLLLSEPAVAITEPHTIIFGSDCQQLLASEGAQAHKSEALFRLTAYWFSKSLRYRTDKLQHLKQFLSTDRVQNPFHGTADALEVQIEKAANTILTGFSPTDWAAYQSRIRGFIASESGAGQNEAQASDEAKAVFDMQQSKWLEIGPGPAGNEFNPWIPSQSHRWFSFGSRAFVILPNYGYMIIDLKNNRVVKSKQITTGTWDQVLTNPVVVGDSYYVLLSRGQLAELVSISESGTEIITHSISRNWRDVVETDLKLRNIDRNVEFIGSAQLFSTQDTLTIFASNLNRYTYMIEYDLNPLKLTNVLPFETNHGVLTFLQEDSRFFAFKALRENDQFSIFEVEKGDKNHPNGAVARLRKKVYSEQDLHSDEYKLDHTSNVIFGELRTAGRPIKTGIQVIHSGKGLQAQSLMIPNTDSIPQQASTVQPKFFQPLKMNKRHKVYAACPGYITGIEDQLCQIQAFYYNKINHKQMQFEPLDLTVPLKKAQDKDSQSSIFIIENMILNEREEWRILHYWLEPQSDRSPILMIHLNVYSLTESLALERSFVQESQDIEIYGSYIIWDYLGGPNHMILVSNQSARTFATVSFKEVEEP